jgi:hypothetical protein
VRAELGGKDAFNKVFILPLFIIISLIIVTEKREENYVCFIESAKIGGLKKVQESNV